MTTYHITYRGEFETTIEAEDKEAAVKVSCEHDWYVCGELHPEFFEVEEGE